MARASGKTELDLTDQPYSSIKFLHGEAWFSAVMEARQRDAPKKKQNSTNLELGRSRPAKRRAHL